MIDCLDVGTPAVSLLPWQTCGGCCSGACDSNSVCCGTLGSTCDAQHLCCYGSYCVPTTGKCGDCENVQNGSCTSDANCCLGRHCETGICCSGFGNDNRVPDAGGAPVMCGTGYCCAGLECCNDGVPPRCTLPSGGACTADVDCCAVGGNGGCRNGKCL
jgi:hypothetical protein